MKRHRIKLLILASVLVILYGLYAVINWGVGAMEDRLTALVDDLRGEGYEISYDSLKISGTPLSITAELLNPKIRHNTNLFYIVGPAVEVSMRVWNPSTLTVTFKGSHLVESTFLSESMVPKIMMDGGKASIKLDGKLDVQSIDFYVEHLMGIKGNQTLPFSMHVVTANFGDLSDPLKSWGDVSFKVLGLDKTIGISRGNTPMNFKLSYVLKGVPDNVNPCTTIAGWRDKGGVVDVLDLNVDWDGMVARANGTVTVDEDLRPLGSFTANFVDYDSMLEVMVHAGYIKKKAADAVGFALHLLSGEPEIGKREISIPLTMQNGELRIGPAKLMKLEPVTAMY